MTARPITVVPNDTLADVLYLLNRYNLSRLPVVENRKLVGIITRSDIIRVEASELSGERGQLAPRSFPSYVVYQTQAPSTGQGRILVPLANPQCADTLLRLAGGLAQHQQWELECLQVIALPRHCDPTTTTVQTTLSRRLLRRAERLGQRQGLSVHTQIRVGQDVAQAILDTIRERHIDLLLMGWEGQPSASDWIFGSVVDTIIHHAACDVVLVKPALQPEPVQLERWLVPIAGGPNAQRAITLLPGLLALSHQPEIRLCQVFSNNSAAVDKKLLATNLKLLQPTFAEAVSTVSLCSSTVADAILDLSRAEQDDVILLGASRESLLQQALRGNIPQIIARNSDCTVVLVRGATGS